MHFSIAIATLLSVACAVNATQTLVKVGFNETLTFNPDFITGAMPGDTVVFQFQAKNHTATQSTFANPCSPLVGGANSGFNPVNASAAQLPQFTITVNVTTPTWFHCAQKNPSSHCAAGMVFAINPPTTGNTFAAFLAAAEATGSNSSASGSSTTSGSSPYATSPYAASGSSTAAGSASSASSTAKSAAMKVGGSAAGALTAVAFLVAFSL